MVLSSRDLSQATVFIAVAEERSFSGAGRRLGVTGSAIGQAIRKIEESVGVQLFIRTTRTVALTEIGQRLLDDLLPSMHAFEQAFRNAQERSNSPIGLVRLHAPRTAAERYVLPAIVSLLASNPGIEVDLSIGNDTSDPLEGGYDLALRIGEVIGNDAVAIRLGPDVRQFAVASPAFVERHGIPSHPKDLVDFPCIGWRWQSGETPYMWEFFEKNAWFSVQVKGVVTLNDRQLIVPLALEGAGIALLSEDDVNPYLKEGRLVNLLEPWSAPYPGWYLCYPRQRHMSRATRALVDAIKARATE